MDLHAQHRRTGSMKAWSAAAAQKAAVEVRLGPEQAEAALKEAHVVEFDVTGRPMRGWVVVEADGLETDDQLSGWVQRAVRFVEGLPCK